MRLKCRVVPQGSSGGLLTARVRPERLRPYTSPVGYFSANGYGLSDMGWNVWEWCRDWDGPYSSATLTDLHGPTSGSFRVNRGCCWYSIAVNCRLVFHDYDHPGANSSDNGFRCVLGSGQP